VFQYFCDFCVCDISDAKDGIVMEEMDPEQMSLFVHKFEDCMHVIQASIHPGINPDSAIIAEAFISNLAEDEAEFELLHGATANKTSGAESAQVSVCKCVWYPYV